jgi:Sigma-70 region 2
MDRGRHQAVERGFDCFAAEVSGPLLRTGHLMTGDAKDAKDLVQETLLRVARRWKRVRSMDHPAAYARRVLVNLVLHDADRRSRGHSPRREGTGHHQVGHPSKAGQAVRQMTHGRWHMPHPVSLIPSAWPPPITRRAGPDPDPVFERRSRAGPPPGPRTAHARVTTRVLPGATQR